MKHFFARRAAHGLKHVRADAHTASAALFVTNFRERHVVVFLHDAIVMIHHVFQNLRDRSRAFGVPLGEFFFSDALFGVDFCALSAGDVFHFFQQFFSSFDSAVIFLAGNHLLEQAVLGFGDFVFGHLHFVLQSLVGLVGFHLRSLVFIFANSVFPLLDVQFVFLAVLHRGDLRSFAFFHFRFGAGYAGVHFGDFLGEGGEARADILQTRVDALQVEQVLEDLQHYEAILAQRGDGLD